MNDDANFAKMVKDMDHDQLWQYYRTSKLLITVIAVIGVLALFLGIVMSTWYVWIPVGVAVLLLSLVSSGLSNSQQMVVERILEVSDK